MTYSEHTKNGNRNGTPEHHAIDSGPLDKEQRLYRWRAIMTLGGLYGLTIAIMGIVIPFTYFLNLWSKQKFHYFYVFYGYVFLVSLGFIIYASVMTSRLKGKTTGEDQHGRPLPSVLITDEGVNIYTTVALILFGSLSIVFQVLIFIAYSQDPLQLSCYGYGQIATSILVSLFIFFQMGFLLGHSKTVFNFKPLVMKLGFIHLIAANMCIWGLAILLESAESYIHSFGNHDDASHDESAKERHTRAADSSSHGDSSNGSDSSESFVFKCLQLNTSVIQASPYLIPFMIEFSLIAVGVLYGMFTNVGTRPHGHHLKLINKKYTEELQLQSCGPNNCITHWHWMFLIVTIGATVVHALVQEKVIDVGEHFATVTLGLYFGIQYFLLVMSIVFTIAATYYTGKCHYVRDSPESFFDEMLLLLSLGGFYFLLAFVMIAACSSTNNPDAYPVAQLYIAWVVLNYIQATMQVGFTRDGLRRRALTRACFTNHTARNLIIMNATCSEGLWIVTSFMVKGITNSSLMTDFYSSLTWIIVSSIFLPLTIFFRFHCGACLSEVIEGLYHGSCYLGKRRVNAKHWEHKD